MEQILRKQLHAYLVENNPDVLIALQDENRLTEYLTNKVEAVHQDIDEMLVGGKSPIDIQEYCLQEMTRDLRPSKYHYIRSVLEEEFEPKFLQFNNESGILVYEIINLIHTCDPVFEKYNFSSLEEENKYLQYEIIATIKEYFERK